MKNSSLLSRTRRGFTLVEILVVIGVIALLAGIAFPVFSRARENGRRTSCASNLKQLGLAFQQYAQDNNGRYPRAANYQAWESGRAYWVTGTRMASPNGGLALDGGEFTYQDGRSSRVEDGALFPFVKEANVYRCPSIENGDKKRLTYSMNCAISMINQVRVRTPSEIVLLVDESKSLNDGYFWSAIGIGGVKATDELTQMHNGGGNLLFVDGHVKFFPFKSFPLKEDSTLRIATQPGSPRFRDLAFGANGIAQTGFVSFESASAGSFPVTGPACLSDPLPTTGPTPIPPPTS